MADRIVDPNGLYLSARLVDWRSVARNYPQSLSPVAIAQSRDVSLRQVHLRWLLNPAAGLPTEPFQVWRRLSLPMKGEADVGFQTFSTPLGWTLVVFQRPVIYIRAQFQVTAAQAGVIAYAGAPFSSAIADTQLLGTGPQTYRMSGPQIASLMIVPSATIVSITGIEPSAAAKDPRWDFIESVGLPVTPGEWHGASDMDAPQGTVGALTDPPAAANDRFRRGAPFFGWQPDVEPGRSAPLWRLPQFQTLLQGLRQDLIGTLQKMVDTTPPHKQAQFQTERALLLDDGVRTATTNFKPLQALMIGVGSDPLLSLVAGFGTAYDDTRQSDVQQDTAPDQRSDWDYMVIARYGKGYMGGTTPIEIAAIVRSPGAATQPAAPANLNARTEGFRPPKDTDQAWQSIVRVSWDKGLDESPFRVASFAAVRYALITGAMQPLIAPRRLEPPVLQPTSATTSAQYEQDTGQLSLVDSQYAVADRLPPNPAENPLRYAVAHQDLFGLWGNWSLLSHPVFPPGVQSVGLFSPNLLAVAPASGSVCSATLTFDMSWDWEARSPEQVTLVCRLYAQAKRGDPPSVLGVPTTFSTRFPGPTPGAAPLVLSFAGNTLPGLPATVSLQPLNEKGTEFVTPAPSNAGPRRYRVTITGFELDFAGTGHIGIALWARGQEHRVPRRVGPWNPNAAATAPEKAALILATASDPRPPIVNVQQELVNLAGLADARGEHAFRLSWAAVPGAVGYFLYESTESKIRFDRDLGEPAPGLTLSDRLAELRAAFQTDPARNSFTRRNAKALAETSFAATLPRGTKEIHLYIILAVSAGGIESAWPDNGDPLRGKRMLAYAAPQIKKPTPPTLEVSLEQPAVAGGAYTAKLRVATKAGATVNRVDVHRVRNTVAALHLESMGPPVASLTGPTAGWNISPRQAGPNPAPGEDQPLGTLLGADQPTGSWKRIHYRATTWTNDDPLRGIIGSRSESSAVRAIVVPPANPPALSAIRSRWPGGAPERTGLLVDSDTPAEASPLGPHRVRIGITGADGKTVFAYPPSPEADDRALSLPTAPPDPTANGAWRVLLGEQWQYQVAFTRPNLTEPCTANVRLTDPLGRITEQVLVLLPLPVPTIDNVTAQTLMGTTNRVVRWTTNVPIADTAIGPYRLFVSFRRNVVFPRVSIPITFERALSAVDLLTTPEIDFAGTASLLVRRAATNAGQTEFHIGLRTSGRLVIRLTAPNGTVVNRTGDVT